MKKKSFLLILLMTATGCGSGSSSPTSPTSACDPSKTGVSFSTDLQPIIDSSCITGCHTSGGSSSFLILNSSVSYGNLVNQSATQSAGTLVVPGDASNSVLYLRISGSSLGSQMPKNKSPLNSCNQSLFQTWINEGANNN